MPRHFPRCLFLAAVGLCGSALEGCSVIAMSATTLRPRPLTAAQSSLVNRAGSLGVVAVVEDSHAWPGRALAPMLDRTGLFRAVVRAGTVVVPCEIESLAGVGWIPLLMNVLPGWSPGNTEKTTSFGRRLAYGIISRLHPPPPPQRRE